ncbi:AraC family transcriptional regulator [Litoribacillus peritrichatus]|uniref:AraC family transcriptional regulator n=1 Tax=Litoribacillus peritrichatus TaxID=718191 RepID=A0ABP7MB16_9GAMM
MDVFSDVLRRLQLRGSSYFCSDFHDSWGIDEPASERGQFHIVIRGDAWLSVNDEPEVLLKEGDIVVLPHGDAHWLASSPKSAKHPAIEVVTAIQSGQSPFEGDVPGATLLCGYFEYDDRTPHPLLNSLPPLVYLSTDDLNDSGWLLSSVHSLSIKSRNPGPGREALVDRLTEVVLIEIFRLWLEQHSEESGLFSALCDERISKAIYAIHGEPGMSWTVASLAKESGMSRTIFAQEFHDKVGQPPMVYLTNWRMAIARDLLKSGESVLGVAMSLGYQSEASFSKAFKKVLGITPGVIRKG